MKKIFFIFIISLFTINTVAYAAAKSGGGGSRGGRSSSSIHVSNRGGMHVGISTRGMGVAGSIFEIIISIATSLLLPFILFVLYSGGSGRDRRNDKSSSMGEQLKKKMIYRRTQYANKLNLSLLKNKTRYPAEVIANAKRVVERNSTKTLLMNNLLPSQWRDLAHLKAEASLVYTKFLDAWSDKDIDQLNSLISNPSYLKKLQKKVDTIIKADILPFIDKTVIDDITLLASRSSRRTKNIICTLAIKGTQISEHISKKEFFKKAGKGFEIKPFNVVLEVNVSSNTMTIDKIENKKSVDQLILNAKSKCKSL
jgi:hypothetical protein